MKRAFGFILIGLLFAGCEANETGAYAKRVSSPDELIGGPKALGGMGDWLIGNNKIRIIIQDQGWSRGFGVFGGGILDADLVRPGADATANGGKGRDNFGEFFPALFMQAFDVQDQWVYDPVTGDPIQVPGIEILNDGSDGKAAVIRTRASGGDFLTMVQELMELAVPSSGLLYETDYILEPGARFVKITGRIINTSSRDIALPDAGALGLLESFGIGDLQLPIGDIALFGDGNLVYAPGAVAEYAAPGHVKPVGFDLRFSVDASYKTPRNMPAMPGLVVDFLATASDGVSYGVALEDSDRNYTWMNKGEYQKDPHAHVTKHSMMVPFLIDSFTGAYYVVPPSVLSKSGSEGDTFEYSRYLILGTGDVASIRDELYKIRGMGTGTFEGKIENELTGKAESEAWVHILDSDFNPYSQVQTDADGRFRCRLEEGSYYYRVTAPGRNPWPIEGPGRAPTTPTIAEYRETLWKDSFSIEPKTSVHRHIRLPAPAELEVSVRDESGRLLPAKVTVVSTWKDAFEGQKPMEFLFDFSLGEHRKATDLSWRSPDGTPGHQYVEKVFLTHDGFGSAKLRPSFCTDSFDEASCSTYDIYISRGPEYDLQVEKGVVIKAGERRSFDAELHRVVDTENWISTDLHVHMANSIDSDMGMEERVLAAASEGLELPVATDHNFLTDYKPTINAMGLQEWLTSMVGVELSTLEMGHINGFPLKMDTSTPSRFPFVGYCHEPDADKVNGTAFDWVQCTAGELFSGLRELGAYSREETIVQVNHPRDTILGYFNEFYLNPYTAEPERPTGDNVANYPEAGYFVYPHDRAPGQFAPENFSWDFEAIEVFNGKRMDMLHGFSLAEDIPAEYYEDLQDPCLDGHPENGPGKPLLRKGGYIAYPGVVDDWMNMLNVGLKFTATGNSDSHSLSAEVGTPRTYIWVAPDEAGARDEYPTMVHELDIVDSIKKHRALVTNGPFLNMAVSTAAADSSSDILPWPVGSTVLYSDSNVGREVNLVLEMRWPQWMLVDTILIYANGKVVKEIDVVAQEGERNGGSFHYFTTTYTSTFDVDTYLVAEARSSHSLFPVMTPNESPPTNVSEVLGAITAGMGTSTTSAQDGVLSPAYVQKVFPYALTNPIWLDIDANGTFDPPGNDAGPAPAENPAEGCPEEGKSLAESPEFRDSLKGLRDHKAYDPLDVREIFNAPEKR